MKPRSRFQEIAERLTDEAERSASVHVYISAEDVAEALGVKDFEVEEPYKALRKWIADRRLLGFEPTADDVLDWVAEADVEAARVHAA